MSKDRKNYHKEWYQKNKERIAKEAETKKELKKEYDKEYREKNKEKLNEYYSSDEYKKHKKEYYLTYKDIIIEKQKDYREANNEKIKERNKQYRKENKQYINDYQKYYKKERRKNDPLYRLIDSTRSMIKKQFKLKGYIKESRTFEILGCSYEDFKIYLESFFKDDKAWMNWDNYGNPKDGIFELNKSWDIDHIKPLSSATTEEEIIKLNHYTNLQPLCSFTNRFIKKDNY